MSRKVAPENRSGSEGAAAGALSGKLSDYGIDDDFIKLLAAEMQPNSSAIFGLVRQVTLDKVAPEIRRQAALKFAITRGRATH